MNEGRRRNGQNKKRVEPGNERENATKRREGDAKWWVNHQSQSEFKHTARQTSVSRPAGRTSGRPDGVCVPRRAAIARRLAPRHRIVLPSRWLNDKGGRNQKKRAETQNRISVAIPATWTETIRRDFVGRRIRSFLSEIQDVFRLECN